VNVANILTLALTNLNITLTAEGEERKTVNYPTFSEREKEDIDDFITELEKAFVINKVPINRKYVVVASYLKEIVANYYDRLVGIIR